MGAKNVCLIKDVFIKDDLPEEYHDKNIYDFMLVVASRNSKGIDAPMFVGVPMGVAFGGDALRVSMNGKTVVLWGDRDLTVTDLIPVAFKPPTENDSFMKYLAKNRINVKDKSKDKDFAVVVDSIWGKRKAYNIVTFSESNKNMIVSEVGSKSRTIVSAKSFFRENKIYGVL